MYEENPEDPLANVDPERVSALLTEVGKRMEECGLFMLEPMILPADDSTVVLVASFRLSKFALTTQVLDPEQENFDQQFRMMQQADIQERVKEIKENAKKRKKEEG